MPGPRGSNVGLTDMQRASLTPEQIKPMEEGSKAILAALFVYATGLWAMKGQMLFLYLRFTIGLWQEKLVKWTAIVCGLFWVAIILVITCRCVPIQKTWQVYPDPGGKIGNRYFFVAVLCVNAPCVKPLFSSSSWLKGAGYSSGKKYTPNNDRNEVPLHKINKDMYPITDLSIHASTEHINRPSSAGASTRNTVEDETKLQIQHTTEVEITSWDPVDQAERGRPS
ncbi:hypothetical protein N0V86_009465 [Didymella sp. IMI 355093]|nr:hypothetical protein N0V86_009465 [Didymella sp. IMI 355093]